LIARNEFNGGGGIELGPQVENFRFAAFASFFPRLSVMQIFVKALSGTRTIQVEENDCVELLRQRIEELEGELRAGF
jgi:hypothetical protein